MTEKISISRHDDLPMPLIYLHSPQALADWYLGQLARSLERGCRKAAISCFSTESMGYETARAAYAVLRAVTDFLYDHPEMERLDIRCAGEEVYRAYCFHWNMWYAARKPLHDEEQREPFPPL